ncbi:MAG: hypothetical protein AUJ49_11770 [Desulfovibrionaceae bacterium CG1_02_65_16]|nr:MAG: hypothetical protein AUJ49_11770 [Desulfovibrionaceae bacterium CG1_02_65_16]
MTLRMDAGAKVRTYKIGQAAKLLDVKPFVLRFWEGEFKDVLVPVRTPAGQRAYTEANVATVREIKRLLYDEGLTIEGAKKRLGQASARPAVGIAAAGMADAGASPVSTPSSPGLLPPDTAAPPMLQHAAAEAGAAARADALARVLADVARELSAIRDLLT